MRPLTKTARGQSVSPRAVAVVVASGPDAGARLELTEGSVLIGTRAECDLVLTDPTVSRQHARFELRADGLRAVDLKSRNGILLNGSRIHDAVVPVGARVQLGNTELRIDALGQVRPNPGALTEFHGLMGSSAAMRELIGTVAKVSRTDGTVLIHGETGVGKEVAARAIHEGSGRKGPLVVFDCGAASPGVIASELFGHVRGAFTDARTDRPGAVVEADGGTLFLDEVGELDLSLQPALLRMLDTHEVKPVGGSKSRKVDVRVVAATNRDLEAEVDAGRFRRDLMFRLAVVTVTLPPLRERLDDLPMLAERILRAASLDLEINEERLAILRSYSWPGNVRELKNVLFRMATLGGQPEMGTVRPPAANGNTRELKPYVPPEREEPSDSQLAEFHTARESMIERFERQYLTDLLATSENNVSLAARRAGMARGHLYRLLKKHGLASR